MRATFVLALLAVVGCEKSPTAPPSNIFLVTAFATPQTLEAGGTTNVIIGITNVSNVSQTFDQNFCGPSFRVDTTAVYGSPSGCFMVDEIRTLAPGEQAVYTEQWTTLAVDSTGRSTGPLPAGTYAVRGARIDGTDSTKIKSVPFTVQLTP